MAAPVTAPVVGQKATSPLAIVFNTQAVGRSRGVVAFVAGLGAGVLGLTGTHGFIAHFALQLVVALLLLFRMGWRPDCYFPQSSPLRFITSGLTDNIVLFVFCWALAFTLVHIF